VVFDAERLHFGEYLAPRRLLLVTPALNGCCYWPTLRYAGARHAGATETKIAAIDDERSVLLTSRERIAVRFAETLAVDHHKVDDALWTEMRRHFSEAEITELAAHTMLYIGFGRLNEIVGVDPP
jgi:alkylhydroperoxidase family enzyme